MLPFGFPLATTFLCDTRRNASHFPPPHQFRISTPPVRGQSTNSRNLRVNLRGCLRSRVLLSLKVPRHLVVARSPLLLLRGTSGLQRHQCLVSGPARSTICERRRCEGCDGRASEQLEDLFTCMHAHHVLYLPTFATGQINCSLRHQPRCSSPTLDLSPAFGENRGKGMDLRWRRSWKVRYPSRDNHNKNTKAALHRHLHFPAEATQYATRPWVYGYILSENNAMPTTNASSV